MKKITLSLATIGGLILTGCMSASNLTPQEIKSKNLTPRDVIDSNKYAYKIFDDNSKATLFATMGTQMANNINIAGVERVTEDMSNYCEAIGGKWKYGDKFVKLAKKFGTTNPMLYLKAFKNRDTNLPGIGRCEAPNGKSFSVYELGLFDVRMRNIASGLGGGVVYYWHRYFKIKYDTPNKPKKDYVLSSYKEVFIDRNGYNNINKVIDDYQNITNTGRDNYFLITLYPICKNFGGTEYIATDVETDMKKETMQDYLFKMYDELYKDYGENLKTETPYNYLKMFPVKKKGYIWCQNTTNPNNEFMLIWRPESGYFTIQKGINWNLIKNLKEEKEINTNQPTVNPTKNKIANVLSALQQPQSKIDDKNVLNIAKAIMYNKRDISINTGFVNYKGYYLPNIDGADRIVIEKIYNNDKRFYNFIVENNQLKFIGTSLQGITNAEKNRFNINKLKSNCKLNGTAMEIVNGLKLYCKYNNGVYRFIFFDNNDKVLDVF